MTREKLFKQVGVRNEQEFYEKYPDEETFKKSHPEIPEMFLGGLLKGIGSLAKTALPTALSFIPGVGGALSSVAGGILGGMGEGGQGGKGGGKIGGQLLGAGLSLLPTIAGLFGKKKNPANGAPGLMPAAGAAGAAMLQNMQANRSARDQFLQAMQPNMQALMNQFGSDDNPLLARYGGGGKKMKYAVGGMVGEADVLPQSMRRSGMINAEVESGEVVEDQTGNVEYVDPANPHANDHEQGGALMSDAHRVLEATSTKKGRTGWKDKMLRMSPEEAEEVTGVKPKKSVSHAGALMHADEYYSKQRGKYTKALAKANEMKRPDSISRETAKLNFKIGKSIPTADVLFDKVFDRQEAVKAKYGIDSGGEMQYGGVQKYTIGGEDPKKKNRFATDKFVTNKYVTDKFRVPHNDLHYVIPPPNHKNAPSLRGTWDPVGVKSQSLYNNLKSQKPELKSYRPGSKQDVSNAFAYPGELVDIIPGMRERYAANTGTPVPVTSASTAKKGTDASVTSASTAKKGSGKKATTASTTGSNLAPFPNIKGKEFAEMDKAMTLPDQEAPVKSWEELRSGKTPFDFDATRSLNDASAKPPVSASSQKRSSAYQDEPLNAGDYRPLVQAMTLRKAPVRFNPIEMDTVQMRKYSVDPLLDQNNADYRAALQQLRNNPTAVAQLQANKYRANNQAMGQAYNMNVDISNQEAQMNTQIRNSEAMAKNQNLSNFDAKVQARDANYATVKNDLMNQFQKNIQSNRAFNQNAKMMLEFAGRGMYDKEGNYIGPALKFATNNAVGSNTQAPGNTSETVIDYGVTPIDGKVRPQKIRRTTTNNRTKK